MYGFSLFGCYLSCFAAKTPSHKALFSALFDLENTQRRWVFNSLSCKNVFFFRNFLLKTGVPAPIAVEILLLFPLKSKRLQRIAGNCS
ncbi:hypothetical protein DM790_21435 [Flavobacterium collinsii]|nr:hypothetical protein [Flavobacterium collinsii]